MPRPRRWAAAVATLVELQDQYRCWLDNLPARSPRLAAGGETGDHCRTRTRGAAGDRPTTRLWPRLSGLSPPSRPSSNRLAKRPRGGGGLGMLPETPGYLTHNEALWALLYHRRAGQPGTAMTAHSDEGRGSRGCRAFSLRPSHTPRALHWRQCEAATPSARNKDLDSQGSIPGRVKPAVSPSRAMAGSACVALALRRPQKRGAVRRSPHSSPNRFAITRFTGGNASTARIERREKVRPSRLSLMVCCIAFNELRTARKP